MMKHIPPQLLTKKSKIMLVSVILLCILLVSPAILHAQTPPPSFSSNADDTSNLPIDGGISLLLAAGIGYGTKKLHAAKMNKKAMAEKDNTDAK